jgi:hypothetical protein
MSDIIGKKKGNTNIYLGGVLLTDADRPGSSERLALLMQRVGFAVWQLQELETTVATYVVVRIRAHRGMGVAPGELLMKKAEGRTLGSLLTELGKWR